MHPKVLDAKALEDYRVLITFDSGEKRVFNVAPYICGDWFGKLKDTNFFNTVYAAGRTIRWVGGQDIAPHELYDYSEPYI